MESITTESSLQVLSKDETSDLLLWPILRMAGVEFLRRVAKFYVFNHSQSALMLMRDELACYAIGDNSFGLLGIGNANQPRVITEPREVLELRGKTVIQFASGWWHVMALTANGDLYGWGRNWMGQVGGISQESMHQVETPVLVMKNISMVACGKQHTAALSSDGTVWLWGQWHFERPEGVQLASSIQIVPELKEDRVVQIECGEHNCLALTDQGHVYHWGLCEFGGRRRRKTGNFYYERPQRLPTGQTVALASGGRENFFTLTSDGRVYHCYFNSLGRFKSHLVKLNQPVEAISRGGCFKLKSGRVAIQIENDCVIHTNLTSMADVGSLYICAQTAGLVNLPSSSIIDSALMQLSQNFNHPFEFDLTLRDYKLGFEIHLNRTKVIAKSNSAWLANEIGTTFDGRFVLQDLGYSYVVWFTYLRYLYTNTVGVIESEWACELLELAIKTNDVDLQNLCLHTVVTYRTDGIRKLVQSKNWPNVRNTLDTNLTIANCSYYFQVAEQTNDQALCDKILEIVSQISQSTAGNIMKALDGLSSNHNPAKRFRCVLL